MIHNLRAVVLWSRRSRDADKLLGIFTDRMGRLTVKATSAAKPTAKFAALTEPFVESEMAIYLRPGQVWGKIVGGQLHRSFPAIRTQMDRGTAAAWVCEVVTRLTPEEQPSLDKFSLLVETLDAVETASRFDLLRLAFTLRFLSFAGLGVDHRDPWLKLKASQPDWAEALLSRPLRELGEVAWDHLDLKRLQQLAGGIVQDHLAHHWHAEDICRQYPYLSLAQVHTARPPNRADAPAPFRCGGCPP